MLTRRRLICAFMVVTATGAHAAMDDTSPSKRSPGVATGFPRVTLVTPIKAKAASDCRFKEMMEGHKPLDSLLTGSAISDIITTRNETPTNPPVDPDLPAWLTEKPL